MIRFFRRRTPTPRPAFVFEPEQPAARSVWSFLRGAPSMAAPARVNPFRGVPEPPPGVLPTTRAAAMALDDAMTPEPAFIGWAASESRFGEGLQFLGYPYLSELAQRPEYRHVVETWAEELTRKWVELVATGDDDQTVRIEAVTDQMETFRLRDVFRNAIERDGFMGQGIIYIDTGAGDDPELLASPLIASPDTIEKGQLRGFLSIDPIWCSPLNYNANDPLRPDFLVPQIWIIMGKRVHSSRLLFIRGRELPDMLKPAYNFGGLSMSQMLKPSVDNWLRTRQSVSDLLHSFTVFILKTSLSAFAANASALGDRLAAFIMGRDNKGLMLVDKETEELDNISVPLGGLDHLQAQAQEQMAAFAQLPLVKFLGITPTGLNATADGEIRVMYDRVHAKQEKMLADPLRRAIDIIQISMDGRIEPSITFKFVDLWEMDAAGAAAVAKTNADTDAVYIQAGVISNEEARDRLRADAESPYQGLAGDAPDMPDVSDVAGLNDDPTERIDNRAAQDIAMDREWNEADHPRGQPENAGQFGEGGGSAAAPAAKTSPRAHLAETRTVNGKREMANGSPLPAHIQSLKIPPAWTDVRISADPKASLLAVGRDVKGRVQSVYSEEFTQTNAAAKFARIHELADKFPAIQSQNAANMQHDDARVRESADCMALIMQMGIRPGSDDDTGAKVKAYGATTLQGRHVVQDGDDVYLRFVGKKGVNLNLKVPNTELGKMLLDRSKTAGSDGALFGINEKTLLAYTHTLDGGGFKTKDFRTHLGTMTAYDEVRNRPAPKDMTSYKKAVLDVAKVVSSRLGNTPVIALQSYISPTVFASWKITQ